MMTAITDTFTEDHHRCDRLLAAAEASTGGSDWSAISVDAAALVTAMDRHFALEEEIVFPALAQVFFVAENPVEIMCNEHAQMRQLLAEIGEAVDARDKNALLGILERCISWCRSTTTKKRELSTRWPTGHCRSARRTWLP